MQEKEWCKAQILVSLVFLLFSCTHGRETVWDSGQGTADGKVRQIATIIDQIQNQNPTSVAASALSITEPYDQTIFPPDIAPFTITWKDTNPESRNWLLTLRFTDGTPPIHVLAGQTRWTPEGALWEKIKAHSIGTPAEISITGIDGPTSPTVTSRDRITILTAAEPVAAAVFFRRVPLPFSTKNFDQMKWCLGNISTNAKPKVVMENLPVCASCHLFSRDGKTMSMEMNFGGDGGAQFVTPVRKDIRLTADDFMSWNDYPRTGVLPKSRGLFGKMSPSANYLVSSVNEISLALITNEAAFSQVFFPTYGILATYSIKERKFTPLPGADDFQYVHANPNWSPDEQFIAFCRARTKNEVHENIANVVSMFKDEGIHALNEKYNIQFDLYQIPFHQGQGGIAKPIEGACKNGFSNYFPRYSPDGKWIVYTRSKTGIMLQPDSELYIVPSNGGVARRMTCNRKLFNSWHSWSPNGRWLLFSSKVNTPFTEIFLTHVDEAGNDSPPVRLSQFSSSTHAANVPEFVNIAPDAIESIRVQGYHD